jgi:hypothetical protein
MRWFSTEVSFNETHLILVVFTKVNDYLRYEGFCCSMAMNEYLISQYNYSGFRMKNRQWVSGIPDPELLWAPKFVFPCL